MLDFAVFCPENMKKITLALVDKSDFFDAVFAPNGAQMQGICPKSTPASSATSRNLSIVDYLKTP